MVRFSPPLISLLLISLQAVAQQNVKPEDSIAYYDNIITKKLINQDSAWYKKGVIYYNLGQLDKAANCFQQTVWINPYYTAAHYFLGNIAFNNGNIVAAYLSFVTNLAIIHVTRKKTNSGYTFRTETISTLNNIACLKDEVVKKAAQYKKSQVDNFDSLQNLLLSKSAFIEPVPSMDVQDTIIMQLQALLNQLSYNMEDTGFWMQYYVPLYEDIKQGFKYFKDLAFLLSKELNMKDEALVKDYKWEWKIGLIDGGIFKYMNAIKESQEYHYDEKGKVWGKGNTKKVGNSAIGNALLSGFLSGLGTGITNRNVSVITFGGSKEIRLIGSWEFYYENGQLQAKGIFNNNGKKKGRWLWYHNNGILRLVGSYTYSEFRIGAWKEYYENGNLKHTVMYNLDSKDGECKEYHENGQVKINSMYIKDKLDGKYQEFDSNGKLIIEKYYEKGKLKK